MRDSAKKLCSEDLPSFQEYRAGGIVQSECFYAARLARRMEKNTVTGTSWRTGKYSAGGLFSTKSSIWEKLTTLNIKPGSPALPGEK
jgi:hypothetical protein